MLEDLSPRSAVEFAVKTEELGRQFYGKLVEKFSDRQDMVEVFSVLASDEDAHQAQFQALLGTLPVENPREPQHIRYLKAVSMLHFFEGKDGLYKDLYKIQTPADAFERALRLEQATLGFYRILSDALGKNDPLEAIIRAEQEHVATLESLMRQFPKATGLEREAEMRGGGSG